MEYSVIIPSLRRPELLPRTVAGLLECDPRPREVLIVDADPERSAEAVAARFDRVDRSPAVRYFATAPGLTTQRNLGIDEATGDTLLFLDDDVTIPPNTFERLDETFRDPAVVGATGRVIEPDTRVFFPQRSRLRSLLPGGGAEGTFTRFGYPRYVQSLGRPRDIEYMLGCFMAARREAADRVRFDENMTGYALAEDEDFSFRLSRLGRIRYLPDLVVHHHKTGFSHWDQRALNRLIARNRTYLFRKNFERTPLARAQFGMLIALLVVHRLVNREWRGAQGLVEGAAEAWRAR